MFRRKLVPVWIGTILLSGMFLMGQEGGWGVGTTEITAVCNGFVCEQIEPEQQEAQIGLTGLSSIYLVSDFFSEATFVELCYTAETEICFDITDICRLNQDPEPGDRTLTEIAFNTLDLPLGPVT